MKLIVILGLSVLATACEGRADANDKTFKIEVVRQLKKDGLIYGTIGVNDAGIGGTFENADLKIPAGTYKGMLRYWSENGHAQGSFGSLGKKGDFLLEVANVVDKEKKRTDILFHGGDKPHHSKGCILLGPVVRDASGTGLIDEKHPLRKLRKLFYGSDNPDATPDKEITIMITDQEK